MARRRELLQALRLGLVPRRLRRAAGLVGRGAGAAGFLCLAPVLLLDLLVGAVDAGEDRQGRRSVEGVVVEQQRLQA